MAPHRLLLVSPPVSRVHVDYLWHEAVAHWSRTRRPRSGLGSRPAVGLLLLLAPPCFQIASHASARCFGGLFFVQDFIWSQVNAWNAANTIPGEARRACAASSSAREIGSIKLGWRRVLNMAANYAFTSNYNALINTIQTVARLDPIYPR